MSEDDKNKGESDKASNTCEVIDFTLSKLEQMADEYESLGLYEQADEVYGAISLYKSGKVAIKWQKGMPFIILSKDGTPKKPNESE